MKLLFTMYREGGFVDRNWVKGSGIYYRGKFGGFGVVKFNACYSVTPVKLLEPKSGKSPYNKYRGEPFRVTQCTFVRTSKAFRVIASVNRRTFGDSWVGLGKGFTVGGGYE